MVYDRLFQKTCYWILAHSQKSITILLLTEETEESLPEFDEQFFPDETSTEVPFWLYSRKLLEIEFSIYISIMFLSYLVYSIL